MRFPTQAFYYVFYVGIHLACAGAIWTGVTPRDAVICLGSYYLRIFGLGAGYHRYFSHKSFQTSRGFQYFLAFLGTLSVHKGVLWWAAKHRHHHRYSDTPEDYHSPMYKGFLYCHSGWFLDSRHLSVDTREVPDLTRYPELVWLNDWSLLPVSLYALGLAWLFGWHGFVWGFAIPTVVIWHAVHSIGTFAHRHSGYRTYPSFDNSRNCWFLNVLLLGDGWHNNHHFYPSSARCGFKWWEFDPTYRILQFLSRLGLVWGLHLPPAHISSKTPAMDRRLERCQHWIVNLRLSLAATIDGMPPLAGRTEFKEWVENRIDDFHERTWNLLAQGPLEVSREISALRTSILERAAALDGMVESLARELDRNTANPQFAAMFSGRRVAAGAQQLI